MYNVSAQCLIRSRTCLVLSDKLLSRGEKIELLVDKTESLNQSAFTFEKSVSRCSALFDVLS